jgi:ribose/xylose/arabinose/galactoside ABC-type transport system permease subunit
MVDHSAAAPDAKRTAPGDWWKVAFVRVGVLPFLMVVAVIVFTAMSDNFLTSRNLMNVLRQSTYLTMVSMAQMVALITGGIDLSVGTTLALTSVSSALVMAGLASAFPDLIWLAILGGMAAGLLVGAAVGMINGTGVAVFGVNPFMMTLGMTSVGFGAALFLTSGMPVQGMPPAFGSVLGYGTLLGIPAPVYVTAVLAVVMYLLLNWTRFGRYLFAVGGSLRAAQLSGISTPLMLFLAYVLCAVLTTIAGLMLTARLGTGEANIGASMPLESIAACVIGGVSLSGGVGRLSGVILGALFIGLVQNGMNLARIDSYLQMVVIGTLLIAAVIADRLRHRMMAELRA